jgi:ATP-dependent DNA ligase
MSFLSSLERLTFLSHFCLISKKTGHFDALIVGYYEGEKLYYVGKVRNGFVPQVRREVYRKLKGLEIDACPFANLPEKKRTMWALTRDEMKNCMWLQPELVAQIEFAEWTPDNHLRHSKFIGLREDKEARQVVPEKVMTKNHASSRLCVDDFGSF